MNTDVAFSLSLRISLAVAEGFFSVLGYHKLEVDHGDGDRGFRALLEPSTCVLRDARTARLPLSHMGLRRCAATRGTVTVGDERASLLPCAV